MKKKGSALVFSVLMLAFFLAISLNIFFLARKKSERAGVKVSGERINNNIDIASSLGYQELKLAEEFVREGFLYDASHPNRNDSYTVPASGSYLYIDPTTGDFSDRYAGIQINNFIDYFSSHWNPDPNSSGSKNQKLLLGELISGDKIISRAWQSVGISATLTPLWELKSADSLDTSLSIGGYSLKTEPTLDTTNTIKTATAVYDKFIYLDAFSITNGAGEAINTPQSVFNIEVKESFDYTKDSDGNVTVFDRNISDFIIRAID